MAIKGSLGEASLGDVCQLLSLGLKTGGLSVTDRSRFGQIFFNRGRIIFAHVVNRRDRLGDLLVRDGVIDAAALTAALHEQARDPRRRLGELLVERQLLSAAALQSYVRRQIEDAVYHLFTWTRGRFFFETDDVPEPSDVLVSLNPDMVLLEAARRVDEWAVIERNIPSLDLLFEVEHAWLRGAGIVLTADQQVLVPLLDGSRSVQELIDETGIGEFAAGKAIYGLVEAGFAQRVGVRERTARLPTPDEELAERRNLAVAFFRTRMLAEAAQEFEAMLAIRPADRSARLHLGLIALHGRDYRAALRAFKEVLEQGGPHFAAFMGLADALRCLGRHEDALLVLAEAETLRPDAPEVPLARGVNHLAMHDLEAACAAFDEHDRRLGAERQPAPHWFYFAGLTYALGGALGEAAACAERGLALYPAAAPLLLLRGLIEERRGNDARAAHWYGRAADEDAGCSQAHRNLGDAAERAGRPRDALAHYRRAVEAGGGMGGDVHTRIGNLLYGAGDFKGAVRYWNRALELNPANHAVRKQLMIVAHAAG
jgi:tetratricopeptide (TPR) repeat protein